MMCYRDKFLNLFLLKSALVILLGVGDIKCYYIIHKADILQITNNILFIESNNLNRKRNNTSFSVQNITAKAIFKNSDRCHISLLFVTITETLTTQQLNNLKALTAGEKALSSTEVMHRYQISSTTSISCSKVSLIKNNILDNKPDEISFQDLIYAYWSKTEYFVK